MKKFAIATLGLLLSVGVARPLMAQKHVKKPAKMVSVDMTARVYYANGCPTQGAKLTQMTLSEAKARGYKSRKCN